MKHIYLNLKRFDVPVELGGVNRLAPVKDWGAAVVSGTQEALRQYDPAEVEFVQYLPEAHLLSAAAARTAGSPVQLGSQGVYRMNTAVGGNFGAFTTNRPASIVKAMGCTSTLIGHCEERNDKKGILAEAGVTDTAAVNRLLNQEIRCAQEAGLSVLYCIGETSEEQPQWEQVLGEPSWTWAWPAWTRAAWSSPMSPCGPSAPARPRQARTTSPRSPALSRSAPAAWMWSTAAA